MADLLVGFFTANKQNNTFTIAAHGLLNSDEVRFSPGATGNTLPTPIIEGTWYYVVNAATDTFQVASASGGTAIVLTNEGTGSNEAWSPAPTEDVWAYELLSSDIQMPSYIPSIEEVNSYAQRGWELYFMGQGRLQGSKFWFMMRKQEPPNG